MFIAKGQMTALADHPLHIETRKRRNCRPGPTVTRTAVAEFGYTAIGKGRESVEIDARTRLTNFSATTPAVTGQSFTATTSRCGRRIVADELTFIAPILQPKRYQPNLEDSVVGLPEWAGAVLLTGTAITLLGLIPLLVARVARRSRRDANRPL